MSTAITDLQLDPASDSQKDVSQTTVKESTTEKSSATPSKEKTVETIVLDGPLSTIYTQALQVAYSKQRPLQDDTDTTIAKEKMAIDASMMGVMEVVDKQAVDSPKPLYIYVTDDEHLTDKQAETPSTAETFDRLRVATESRQYNGIWFCAEDGYKLSRAQCLLSDFIQQSGGRVFYSKESLWRALGL